MWIFITLIVILLTLVAGFFVMLHLGFRAPRIRETQTPEDFQIPFQAVHIPTVANKMLYGWLLINEQNTSHETLIILHGWGGNAELMLPLAIPFHQAGMNILLIDSRNHGNSDADNFSSLPRFAEDLGKSIDWLKQTQPQHSQKIALLGHSVGAGAVIFEASKRDDIDAIISISSFAHPEWMMQRYLSSLHIPPLLIRIILNYIQWIIGLRFHEFAPLNRVCKISSPILIVHGKDDTTIPVEDAQAIIKHCPEPHLSLLEIDGAGHESVDKIEAHAQQLVAFLRDSGFTLS